MFSYPNLQGVLDVLCRCPPLSTFSFFCHFNFKLRTSRPGHEEPAKLQGKQQATFLRGVREWNRGKRENLYAS